MKNYTKKAKDKAGFKESTYTYAKSPKPKKNKDSGSGMKSGS